MYDLEFYLCYTCCITAWHDNYRFRIIILHMWLCQSAQQCSIMSTVHQNWMLVNTACSTETLDVWMYRCTNFTACTWLIVSIVPGATFVKLWFNSQWLSLWSYEYCSKCSQQIYWFDRSVDPSNEFACAVQSKRRATTNLVMLCMLTDDSSHDMLTLLQEVQIKLPKPQLHHPAVL